MNLMFAPLRRYVDFQGRSRRSEYWLWVLFQFIVSLVFGFLKGAFGPAGANNAGALTVITLLNLVFTLAILLPNIAVGVRRLHDTNRTGWWVIFPGVVLLAGIVGYLATAGTGALANLEKFSELGAGATSQQVMGILGGLAPMLWVFLAYIAAALLILVFDCLDGTPGPNRFGADPKGRGGSKINVF